jgi:pimeloyl-ACP methyl ester carboxylesterase
VLPALEQRHDVLAPTLLGHAGGPPADGVVSGERLVDALEQALDDAGFETAHVAGNSLGGYLALCLAARGRARSVVALAPAGGWSRDDPGLERSLVHFPPLQQAARAAAPHADAIVAKQSGRRAATRYTARRFEHIPPDLLAHQIRGVAACDAVEPFLATARQDGWPLDAERIGCPVRIVWGMEDALLPWPRAAARYRDELLPHADWVELDGVGHSPQLDVPLETAQLILGFTAL